MADTAMCGTDEGRGFHVGTASGRPYWPQDPRAEDIHVPDLPVHLSRICRFNGAMDPKVQGIYSVAQHLVLAYTVAPTEFKLEAVLHDAHEAYVHDVIKPLKLMLSDYQDIEARNERAMRAKFGLPAKMSDEVKEIDRHLYATEVRDLIAKPQKGLDWGKLPEPYPFTIYPWTPGRARNALIRVFKELGIL